MKNFIIILISITLFSYKQTPKIEETQESETSKQAMTEAKSEWITLFDGTSFDQWRGYLTKDMFSEWTIEDGAMVFTPREKNGKNIISKEKYTNFILSLEWKISKGGNSGIFWSVFEDEKFPEPYQTGPEIQVLDNERHPDSFLANGTRKAGSIYAILAYPPQFIYPAGEWNHCVLEINHLSNLGKVTMNGKGTITFSLHGSKWDGMVSNSKFKDWEGFRKHQTGHIGLQDHGNKVWFKNIKIKELN